MGIPPANEFTNELQSLSPTEFEQFVAEVWNARGWTTEVTKKSSDRGIDVVATKKEPFNKKHIIQAKRYSDSNPVGSSDLREYGSLYQQEETDIVVIVTTSRFTEQAKSVADDMRVKLVNADDLYSITKQQASSLDFSQYIDIDKEPKKNNKSANENASESRYHSKNKIKCLNCREMIARNKNSLVSHWKGCRLPEHRPSDISVKTWQNVKDELEVECPNCGEMVAHNKKPLKSHWKGCRLPEHRPSDISFETWRTWQNIKDEVNESSTNETTSESYHHSEDDLQCPNCREMVAHNKESLVSHWQGCRLPEHRPSDISVETWRNIKDEVEVECPNCGEMVAHNKKSLKSHWQGCCLPEHCPSDLSVETWRNIKDEVEVECPNCGEMVAHNKESLVSHWQGCRLPEHRPSDISVETWWNIKDEVDESSDNEAVSKLIAWTLVAFILLVLYFI